jgi:hypothetical protein
MLIEAFKSPLQSSDRLPTLLVGGLLTLFGMGLLVAGGAVAIFSQTLLGLVAVPAAAPFLLLVVGYLLRVTATGAREEPAPSFVEWGGLFKGGVGALLLAATYLLPALVLGGIGLAGFAGFAGDAGTLPASASGRSASLLAGGLLVLAYGLMYLYVFPAALSIYGVSGRLRTALWPATTVRAAVTIDYLKGWVVGGATLLVGLALVGAVITVPIAFYLLSVAASLFGRGVGPTLEVTPGETSDSETDADPDRGTLANPASVDDMDADTVQDGTTEPDDPFGEGTGQGGGLASPFDDRDTDDVPGTAAVAESSSGGGGDGAGDAGGDETPPELSGYQVADKADVERHPDPNSAFADLELDDTGDSDADADRTGTEREPSAAADGTTGGMDTDATVEDRTDAGAGGDTPPETVAGTEADTESQPTTDATGGQDTEAQDADSDDSDDGFEWGRIDE